MKLKEFKEPNPETHGELYNKNDAFQGQRKNEHIETILMRHKIVLLPVFLASLIGIIFVLGVNVLIRNFFPAELITKITVLVDFVFVAFLIHYFFISLMNFYLDIVIITNLRLIDINFTAIFSRNMDALDLHNIQDINMKRKGFWRWLFNYGRIVMHNAAGSELFDFKYLKNPLKNYNIINHVHFKAMHERFALEEKKRKKENLQEPKQTDWDDDVNT